MNIAFRRIGLGSQASGHCVELVPIKLVMKSDDPAKELGRMLSQLMLSVACSATGKNSPYEVERKLMGDDFNPSERPKVWERMDSGALRLKRIISKNAPGTTQQLKLLRALTKNGDELLELPLWDLLAVKDFTLRELESLIVRIKETAQFDIPPSPMATDRDAARYSEVFRRPLEVGNPAGRAILQVALFCLRRAEVTGNLPQYVLTYEAILNANLNIWKREPLLPEAWLLTLGHLSRWYSRVEILPPDGMTVHDVTEYLNLFGRKFSIFFPDSERKQAVLRERWDESAVVIGQYPCVPVCA